MDAQQRELAEDLLFAAPKKASFAKQLYFGKLYSADIFPFPGHSDEEKERCEKFLSEVKEFADNKIDGTAIDREAEIPKELIDGLAELGVLGMTIPTQYGGLGMPQHAYCRVAEMIARHCSSTALFLNAHQSIGLKALLLFGSSEQKERWLPALAAGKSIAAFSLTEPNAGSDASGVESRAVFDPLKKVWRINGKKQWTTNGAIADLFTVMAQVEVDTPEGKKDRVSAFLVTPQMNGFEISAAALEKVGMRGTKTTNLTFTDLEVPENCLLGPLGGGLKVCLTVLDYGRVTFGATCLGVAKYLLERATAHAISRYQFKRPLASFSLVKSKIAKMAALTYAMEASTYLTAGLVDANVEDFMLEAAMLKVFCSESLWTILYDTMQIFGGRSFFTDQPFERMMRDARLNMIGEGSNEVLRAFIGAVGMRDVGKQFKELLEGVKNPFLHHKRLISFALDLMKRLALPPLLSADPLLRPLALKLSRATRSFGFTVTKLLIRHREAIIEKQLELDRLASMAMAIYTTTAVISRLDQSLHQHSEDSHARQREIATANLYCQLAFESIGLTLGSLNASGDRPIESLSDLITGMESR